MRFGSVLLSAVVMACVVFASGGACPEQEPSGSRGGGHETVSSALPLKGLLTVGGRSPAIINNCFYRKCGAVEGFRAAAIESERGARKIFLAAGEAG